MPETTDSPSAITVENIRHAMAEFGRIVTEANARQSEHYRAFAEKFGTAFPIAGPDADDLLDMGIVSCGDCGAHVDESVAHLGCGEARGCCDDCHDAACGDRECRA